MRLATLTTMAFLCAAMAFAQDVRFEWDPHPEAAQLSGFKLYQGKQSGSYDGVVATFDGGALTTGTIPKPGLGRYYWVLTAVSTEGLESGYSNEVTLVLKPKPPVLKGVIMTALTAPVAGARKLGEWAGLVQRKNLRIIQ